MANDTHKENLMAFCNFSGDKISENSVILDNAFFTEFLPIANDCCIKVYLLGLYKCNTPLSQDNNLESFARILNMSEEDVMSCFYFWQELNVVQIINQNPFEVRYLPLKKSSARLKKFNPDKYKSFNLKIQELLCERMISTKEFEEYYNTIESLHIDTDAFLKIVEYCIELKGNNVGYNYILSIAKNWAYEGITTLEQVNDRLDEQVKNTSQVVDVLKLLGIKRNPSTDEYQMFLHWTKELEFPLDTIIYLASRQGKNSGGMTRLNTTVQKCYSLKKFSTSELKEFFDNEKTLYDIAKTVCKNLGLYYNNLENVVESYVSNWFTLGFDKDALTKISNYCFKLSIKTLQGMDSKVNQLFKLGLLSAGDIDNYINNLLQGDSAILSVLQTLKIERQVNANDRQLFKTWKYDWNISDEIIDYASQISSDKYMPLQYLNKILSQLHLNNITELNKAKDFINRMPADKSIAKPKKFTERTYTKEQLNSLFQDISEVEI